MSEMVRPYRDLDYPDLVNWYLGWEEATPSKDLLPSNGFIVPGICAGFLYLTDSKLGIVDLYISNPRISPPVRSKFLDLMTLEIIKCAKEHGCKVLMATSKIDSVKRRSQFHGFKYAGDTSVYAKEL